MTGALEAARAGRGGAVFLVGESGIGKSRLASAVAEAAFSTGMSLSRGRASAIDPMTPFRPLTEALLSLLRAEDVQPSALGPYGPVLGRLLPGWGGAGADREGDSLVILAEAVLRLTGLVGRGRGCLMALDDLQNADAETLAVLEYLIDNLDLQPTLLLGAIRDEPCPALHIARAAAQRGQCLLIELDQLDRSGLAALAASCLAVPSVPPAVTDLLWAGGGGNPFMVEELVASMVEGGLLTVGSGAVQVAEALPATLPTTVSRALAQRVSHLGQQARELLTVAAVLGQRFPLAVVQKVTGLSDRELLNLLHGDLAAQLVTPDETTADWYTFHHQLSREAVLSSVDRATKTSLAATLADAVEEVHPGLPDQWCQVTATLRRQAGQQAKAGRLYTEVGRRALAQGAAGSAVTLLDQAWDLLAHDEALHRAEALELLVHALAEAGEVERALDLVATLDQVGALAPRRRADLHTRLGWAAAVAGRSADAIVQVEAARALLGPDAAAEDIAQIDVVAAHLALDIPGPGQLATAERLARHAAVVAEEVPLPVVACQAWQLLGALTRHRDPDEATSCLERARALAVRHNLPIWEIHALIRLGNDDALRSGALDRLTHARDLATKAGAITARYQAESSIALHSILHGDFTAAKTLIDRVLPSITRLKLLETTQYVLLLRAVLAGHQGRRKDLDEALTEFRDWHGDPALHAPRIHGLAGSFCALLEEDRPKALAELSRALDGESSERSVFHLSGRHGLHLLLTVLCGRTTRAEYDQLASNPAGALRWDRQFACYARAVLLGREGRHEEARAAVEEAQEVGAPYAMARHLGLRLVAEDALSEGWGDPVTWLRTAEDYFHALDDATVAGACRALLRKAGVRVGQHREGAGGIPAGLRQQGVTVREFEVLKLLVGRLGNREIAERLHLSPRTVERHVSSLITKTGLPNRIALSEYAADLG
ncbi:DNA-binding CsgD family transcriptional regulator/tetratricopeptide (TPR) repeat protein [Crossiella equi]|uniref:DNA-binding CsgD family transcriptional regulator/tetratricopeptide (TPR) repeat protein n=1 Tax=Crossiella equi TaxID=130796 RepID=A0ABS5AJE4_9PSEU|nr:DNA-binding CsgD family transcriptional regulator/tetratricopeptide (TPR) repeat protein [Crossiella equi]